MTALRNLHAAVSAVEAQNDRINARRRIFMCTYRYVVKRGHYDHGHAAFVYAADAHAYVHSEAARHWISIDPVAPGELERRAKKGQEVILRDNGKHYIDVYPVDEYVVEDAISERRVVGVTGHGHAILESLRRADERKGVS